MQMKITMVLIFLLAFALSCMQAQTENPKSICKDCGNFDLNKIDFTENVDLLASKTEIYKTALVNANNEEKDAQELASNDRVNVYKYNFANQENQILGERPFHFNNQFDFTDLTLLSGADKKLLAYEATVLFEGKDEEIDQFIAQLQKQYQDAPMNKNEMEGDLTVYQWHSDHFIVQLVRANRAGEQERTTDGKTTIKRHYYVKLNYYGNSFVKKSMQQDLRKDVNFAVFDNRHFK